MDNSFLPHFRPSRQIFLRRNPAPPFRPLGRRQGAAWMPARLPKHLRLDRGLVSQVLRYASALESEVRAHSTRTVRSPRGSCAPPCRLALGSTSDRCCVSCWMSTFRRTCVSSCVASGVQLQSSRSSSGGTGVSDQEADRPKARKASSRGPCLRSPRRARNGARWTFPAAWCCSGR
jgi:hypothetical protein